MSRAEAATSSHPTRAPADGPTVRTASAHPTTASAVGTAVSATHITASVFVNDHESGLWADILKWLEETIAPWDPGRYRHNETGEDNAAAHLRSLTIGHEVIVPITAGKVDLGPWQRVFYGEWDGQRKKRVIIKVLGE